MIAQICLACQPQPLCPPSLPMALRSSWQKMDPSTRGSYYIFPVTSTDSQSPTGCHLNVKNGGLIYLHFSLTGPPCVKNNAYIHHGSCLSAVNHQLILLLPTPCLPLSHIYVVSQLVCQWCSNVLAEPPMCLLKTSINPAPHHSIEHWILPILIMISG